MKKSIIVCMIHSAFNHPYVNLDHSEEWIRQLTPKAFSYYLPAYLKLIIDHYYDIDALTDTIISMLTPSLTNGSPRKTWINKNLNYFDIKQKEIIALALQYIYKQHSDQNAYHALNVYWNNFLGDKKRDNSEIYA
ncbi:DUF6714 family protein [Enterobacter bugandensis]|uniref:DUF6714 family protein n=1 Tax=Enterobacter bugandensis TaxID=881260 RepID=UPI0025C80AA7|nr:hypothetical protein [Enterobacter bugandensis]